MIRVYLTVTLLAIAGSCAAFAFYQKLRADELEARAIHAEQVVEQYKQANQILDDHIREVEQERDHWEQQARELDQLEGAGDSLSPYLQSILDRVR